MRCLPALLCGLLIGAHFLRWGNLLAALVCVLFPWALVVWKTREVRIAVQIFLSFGTAVWASTAWRIAAERTAAGEPWFRMALILGGLAAFHVIAALLLFPESGFNRST